MCAMKVSKNFNESNLTSFTLGLDPIVKLWILRLLIPIGLHTEFTHKGRGGFYDERLADRLGMSRWIDCDDWSESQVMKELHEMYRVAEVNASRTKAPKSLRKNIDKIARLIGLSSVDCRIVEFAAIAKTDQYLDNILDSLKKLNVNRSYAVLASILGLSIADIRYSLSVKGSLAKAGIINFAGKSSHHEPNLQDRVSLPSQSFANMLIDDVLDHKELLSDMAKVTGKPELGLSDYPHIQKHLELLFPYVRQSMATGRKGVNVLIYGSPGTGKSQLARVIAKELKLDLYEVADEDGDGDLMDGEGRLGAYRRAQHFLSPKNSLLAFDEVEDIFGYGSPLEKGVAKTHKALINRTLEESIIPTIWLSNTIRGVDKAAIRRFDFVFELPTPPQEQREKILKKASQGLLSKSAITRMAESESLVPAVLTRAASIINVTRQAIQVHDPEASIEFLLNNTLKAQGHKKISKALDPNRTPDVYDSAFINADIDLEKLVQGLAKSGSGRICLYGPPGTGKTAYGRWLAKSLNKKLLVKRASDLIDMYVGGTEKNIADAFESASRDDAILLIDEVDSFLQDRRGATRSWEVTAVNEMLTQMESFAGIFIAATNLMDNLDQAALRRFDLKAKLDYLKPDQACLLFERYCNLLGLGKSDESALANIRGLLKLAPGDFAAIARQNQFSPFSNPRTFAQALKGECVIKEGGVKKSIGFI